MIQLPEDRRPPLTPQLARRVAILGTFALAMFAIIFFRLWFLQVLSGHQYLAQASTNQVRSISTPAPRGKILDSAGNVLVSDKQELDVEIIPSDLPSKLTQFDIGHQPPADTAVYRRLARVLGIRTRPVRCPVTITQVTGVTHHVLHESRIACAVDQQLQITPYAGVRIKRDVSQDTQFYLAERQENFKGVQVQQVYVRQYPFTTLAAQLFGTVGPLSCDAIALHEKPNASNCEVKDARYRGIPQSDYVGQSGLEWYYNHYLQGIDGRERFQVNAYGDFTHNLQGTEPTRGYDLKTSLNINLQRAGQQALAQSIASNYPADAGSFVAMNPDNGQVYAMGSLPTFDPNIFTKPLTQQVYNQLNNASSGYPLLNRATQSVGPTGSTFKPITATAALQSGAWSLSETFDDTGQFCVSGQCRHNAGGAAYGGLDLVNAIRVSSDNFFYNLGVRTNADPNTHPYGGALQDWARKYGIGRPTGVDLGGEDSGTLPTPAWRAGRNKLEAKCDSLNHPTAEFPLHPNHKLPPGGCGIADGTNRPWSVGDNESLAVGQGDVQVTPLQLAVAYSAIANGGNIVQPHIGQAVETSSGTVVQNISPPIRRHLNINPVNLDAIREGLHEAAQSPGGTSDDVMGSFPETVYGKTGTAQYTGQPDYAWYVCFVPDSATNKPILVAVHVERGGFGAVGAAPVARQILNQWFFGNRGKYIAGSSHTL
jgi:penicillin-binding protein 2